jgi:NAD(P)-dependent dehydrogenase (short-subunit alcohol dehydrogenase family)
MERRVAVVTGATGGIGRWIARGLADAGYHTVLVARDAARGKAAIDWIAAAVPNASTELMLADLSSLAQTRDLAKRIEAAHPKLKVLVNNAGMFSEKRLVTPEGHETVLAVNHLSPFVLASALEGALKAGAPSRLVTIGSSSSDAATIDPDDMELTRGWNLLSAYRRPKLAQMMTSFEMAARWKGSGVTVNVVHPGTVATGLIRAGGPIGIAWKIMALFTLTEEQGADTPLYVATSPEIEGVTGEYFKQRTVAKPNRLARDPVLRRRVWDETVRLTTR